MVIIPQTLTKIERQFLLRKYMKNGMDFTDACDKVKEINNHLISFVHKLKTQNKPEEEINKKFKQEFEKLCRKLENL